MGHVPLCASPGFADRARSARGEVVGFEIYDAPGIDPREDIHYATIAFETADGRTIRFRGPSRDGPVDLKAGDAVAVLYDPTDPRQARVDSFMGLWFAATILLVVGTGAVAIPLLTMWQAWKWAKRQAD